MNVGRLSLDNIDRFGETPTLSFEGNTYTNVERDAYAGRLARALQAHGVKPDDMVVVMMPNSPAVTAAFQAIWKIGAVVIPVTPMLSAREVGFILADSEARVAVTSLALAGRLAEAAARAPEFREMLVIGRTETPGAVDIEAEIAAADPIPSLLDRADDDLALLLYTSGTTGVPKGVMLTHMNLWSNVHAVAQNNPLPPGLRTMHVLPLSHSYGILMMNLGYVLGTNSALLTHWDTARVFQTIQDFGVERFSVVPTMLTYMINFPERERYDLSKLRRVNTGAASLLNEIRTQFERVFNVIVKEGYGLSETAPTLTGYHEDEPYRPGSVGRPIPGVEVCIMDFENRALPTGARGEICARGPNVMKGYWKLEGATREAMAGGWFHTGDIGFMDAEGYVYITDRKKDLIIKGGENISPREIEEGLQEHEDVAEVAVFGVPDPTFGEEIVAAVVLKPGRRATEAALKEHLAGYVTKFKVPSRIVFLPALAKNPTGKIQKREIRQEVLAGPLAAR